jgi:choline kinase
MNAVILNAGEGKRLRPLTSLKPKCLLKLNDMTILEHQLANLIKCGILNVVIIVGYRADQIFELVKNKNLYLEVDFLQNPIYYKTNTVYSLWLARKRIKDDFVYLNGDVVFHEEVLKRLLKSHYDTCIAVERKQVSEEEVKVQLDLNLVKAIGKDIELSEAHGEFIGIAKFSKRFNKLFIGKLNEVVKEGKVDEFFEVALDKALRSHEVYAVDVSNLPCTEVDTYEDFNAAKEIYSEVTEKN